MKRTLFSVVLIAGVAAIGNFESGDGIPAPPEREQMTRNGALARARVFREAPFDAAAVDFSTDPNGGVVDTTLTTCRYAPDDATGTTPKFECELQRETSR
jgi:hypothetical protein